MVVTIVACMALQGIGGEWELLPAKTGVVNIQNNIFIPSLSPSLYTVKKVNVPSRPGCHLLNSPWVGIIKFFPARESLVSDTPAGDGKIANLFYSVLE
jgi:hypothetical protein